MFKPIIRMAAGALAAAVIAFAITIAPAAKAQPAKPAPPQGFTKADRLLVLIKGTGCSQHAWPNIDPRCQYDLRKPAGEMRVVRIIAVR
jgi:hypothetical protein